MPLAGAAGKAGGSATDPSPRLQELHSRGKQKRSVFIMFGAAALHPPCCAEDPWSVGNYYLSQLMLRKSWHLSEYIEVGQQQPDMRVP